jgi:CRP-like cAMP-binding protein
LPIADYDRLLPKLERVKLTRGDLVYRANRKIEAVYFPEDAVVAMVDALHDKRTIEVGTIGREGMVGINIFLAGAVSPDQAIVQLPGSAVRMSAQDFRDELNAGAALQRLLLAYARALLAVISQAVACQPAPHPTAAPGALAAHLQRLYRRPRIRNAAELNGRDVGRTARGSYGSGAQTANCQLDQLLSRPYQSDRWTGLGQTVMRVLPLHQSAICRPQCHLRAAMDTE